MNQAWYSFFFPDYPNLSITMAGSWSIAAGRGDTVSFSYMFVEPKSWSEFSCQSFCITQAAFDSAVTPNLILFLLLQPHEDKHADLVANHVHAFYCL